MQNFNINDGSHQMNIQMPYGYQQMRGGQEFPVPITATQNPPQPPPPTQRKPRNSKKNPAPQPQTLPQQQIRMFQQIQQLSQQPPPQQIDQIGTAQINQPMMQIQQMQQQQQNTKIQKQQSQIRPPPPPLLTKDPESFFTMNNNLFSFSIMDSISTDWIGNKQNPKIINCIKEAKNDTSLNFNSIQEYINASNNLFENNQI